MSNGVTRARPEAALMGDFAASLAGGLGCCSTPAGFRRTIRSPMRDFERVVSRRHSDSIKWVAYGETVLPMWVADMDFPAPAPVLEALRQRVDHGVFGYGVDSPELKELVCERLAVRHDWKVDTDAICLLPGLVCALNIACRAAGGEGDGVLVNTPVYPPFLSAPRNQQRHLQVAPQRPVMKRGCLYYEIDFEALTKAVTPSTRLFILCNPHNPTGRVFSREELTHVAEFCLRHDLIICSDEIHCDLLLDRSEHISISVLDAEVQKRSITLISPSKTFNLPGLGCSAAIIPDTQLRNRFLSAARGIVPEPNVLGIQAALAAYREGEEWLRQLLSYLTENRNLLTHFVKDSLPGIRTTHPEATYLAWLDCRNSPIQGNPYRFFLERAQVALNAGERFGTGGEGFVRLNFGCPRTTLEQGLARLKDALEQL